MNYLQDLPLWFVLGGVFIVSALVGSFLNVVIYRLPIMLEREFQAQAREILELSEPDSNSIDAAPFNLVVPRSRCRDCSRLITARDNIPILSYLSMRGRCRACGSKISPFYPIVELLTALLGVWVVAHFGVTWQGIAGLIFVYFLVVLTGIDLKVQLLPDNMTLTLMWLGLLLAFVPLYIPIEKAVLGAAIGYLSLWSIATGFYLLTQREGMGLGDAKLCAALCAWINIEYFPILLLLACFSAFVVAILSRLLSGNPMFRNPMAFGPHLALGGWLTFLYGESIFQWYRGWLLGGLY